MKKTFVLLFLLFISLITYSQSLNIRNFKITAERNKLFTFGSGKFDYQFEIKGDYSYNTNGHYQIDLIIYYESVTPNNEIGRIYWNRENDEDLIFDSYTLTKMWVNPFTNWEDRNFYTNPGKKFILVAKYAGITKQYTYTIPDGDNDGDGVPNGQDDCPNEPGPSSNDGCPEGEADLVLDKSGTIISSECSSCPGPLSNLGSQRHIISRNAGILSFNLIIVDNQGSASAGSSKIGLYLSSDNKLDSNDFKFSTTFSLSSINAGSSKDSSGSIFGSDFDYNQAFGNYYLLLVLDVNKSIDESNEANNVTAIPIRYRENF
ncbi:hypothetical protein ED312_15465 [Sinomicrobium pectinilyticum]|uniref:CARDB domain-containing protein n=1 Tax=Sinomicrobium pectinilyticum TaxID=1084421 RepID=A0A3N0E5E2_SINP1|nr:CARDB domain-containing protein [Sinomicrobium pectinilyticum]RNL83066.1 hypothetical protein ED312_15465 [Sinomicrobium pectinilyticum]